ncbi:MAG: LUD domain-containing protein [Candidatus Korobacteraceae bacterium]
MNDRDAILQDLRRSAPPLSPLPEYPAALTYENPEAQFAQTFTSVGGTFFRVANLAALDAELRELKLYTQARKIVSLVPGAGTSTVDVVAMNQPHELLGVELAIISGEFGVAENGAVWVPGSSLGPQRAIFVISEHLVLVVRAGQIIHTMQHAYERIRFERPGFGVFISGPSKTADIEQSLVIGAHGPRSCTLFLVG